MMPRTQHDGAVVEQLRRELDTLEAVISAHLQDRRGSFALQAAVDLRRERLAQLAELEDAAA